MAGGPPLALVVRLAPVLASATTPRQKWSAGTSMLTSTTKPWVATMLRLMLMVCVACRCTCGDVEAHALCLQLVSHLKYAASIVACLTTGLQTTLHCCASNPCHRVPHVVAL